MNLLDHDQSSQSLLAFDLAILVKLGVQIPKLYATSLHFPQFFEARRCHSLAVVAFFDSDWEFGLDIIGNPMKLGLGIKKGKHSFVYWIPFC